MIERRRDRVDGAAETLAIPGSVRAEVDERDLGYCRVCGKFCGEKRALHHIVYGGDAVGVGGRRHHDPANLVTVGWMFDHDCHSVVHANKKLWVPLLLEVVQTPGVTALQLWRWKKRRSRA